MSEAAPIYWLFILPSTSTEMEPVVWFDCPWTWWSWRSFPTWAICDSMSSLCHICFGHGTELALSSFPLQNQLLQKHNLRMLQLRRKEKHWKDIWLLRILKLWAECYHLNWLFFLSMDYRTVKVGKNLQDHQVQPSAPPHCAHKPRPSKKNPFPANWFSPTRAHACSKPRKCKNLTQQK